MNHPPSMGTRWVGVLEKWFHHFSNTPSQNAAHAWKAGGVLDVCYAAALFAARGW